MADTTVLRGGLVVDGGGGEPYEADIALRGSTILDVGRNLPAGDLEEDVVGCVVTPGFVDIHTHYDAQATWSTQMSPSSAHGVTTVVVGNCGVGFAPCRPQDRQALVRLLEGVEDIPEAVMAEGLPWDWESFPEFLDSLDRRARDIDVATGRSSAAPALAKSMRGFAEYRKTQCDFVRAMYASGNGAEQAQLGCMVDLMRRRVRELQLQL